MADTINPSGLSLKLTALSGQPCTKNSAGFAGSPSESVFAPITGGQTAHRHTDTHTRRHTHKLSAIQTQVQCVAVVIKLWLTGSPGPVRSDTTACVTRNLDSTYQPGCVYELMS